MAHQPQKDPIAPIALVLGLAILGVTVFILIANLFSTIERNSIKGAEDTSRQMAVANESLKPLGNVHVVDKSKPKVARSGEAVYKTVCTSCHSTGILESPKFGSKEQWAPRIANGLPALIKTATDGKGSMPARGGDPTLTDEELKASIFYMTKAAGFDLGGDTKGADTSTESKGDIKTTDVNAPDTKASDIKAPNTKAPVSTDNSSANEKPAKPIKPEIVVQPSAPQAPTAVPEAKPAQAAVPSAPTAPVVDKIQAEPSAPTAPTVEAPTPSDAIKAASVLLNATMEEAAKILAPTAPTVDKPVHAKPDATPAPTAPEAKPVAPVAPDVKSAVPAAPAPVAVVEKVAEKAGIDGEKVYKATCFACHDTGVAASPVLGKKEVWAPKIATGMDALYNSAIKGKGAMPPKGGNLSFSDDEVKAAVDYIINISK